MTQSSRSGFTILTVLVLTVLWVTLLTLSSTMAFAAHRQNQRLLEQTRTRAATIRLAPDL